MIRRKPKKKLSRKHIFWEHFHRVVEMSYEGNTEVLDRLKQFDDDLERQYIIANIPNKYFKFEFQEIKDYVTKKDENLEPINKLESYFNSLDKAAQEGIGLYLSGPHGVAKTTFSIIILKKAISLHYRCFFWKSSDIVEFIRSGWRNEFRKAFFDYIINNVDFLVIDDLARLFEDKMDIDEQAYIDKIFTKRDDLNLATIITTNHSLYQNRSTFGEALYSNFKEKLLEIELIGSDFRDQIGNKLLNKLKVD